MRSLLWPGGNVHRTETLFAPGATGQGAPCMLAAKGLSMDRGVCWAALGISGLLLLLFILDLALGWPFGGSLFVPIDVVGILACLLTAYLSWHTLRELR